MHEPYPVNPCFFSAPEVMADHEQFRRDVHLLKSKLLVHRHIPNKCYKLLKSGKKLWKCKFGPNGFQLSSETEIQIKPNGKVRDAKILTKRDHAFLNGTSEVFVFIFLQSYFLYLHLFIHI